MEELNLRQTPIVNLSAPDAASALTEKLTAELQRVEADQSVVATRELVDKAEAREQQLHRAHLALNARNGEILKWLSDVAGTYVESLIESAASGEKRPDVKIAGRIIDSENESRLICRAIERIALHSKPVAEITRVRAQAELQHARAKILDTLAHDRAQRLLGTLSAAVGEETVIQIDTKSGVAGMLIGLADEARKEARGREASAKELQKEYEARNTPKGQN